VLDSGDTGEQSRQACTALAEGCPASAVCREAAPTECGRTFWCRRSELHNTTLVVTHLCGLHHSGMWIILLLHAVCALIAGSTIIRKMLFYRIPIFASIITTFRSRIYKCRGLVRYKSDLTKRGAPKKTSNDQKANEHQTTQTCSNAGLQQIARLECAEHRTPPSVAQSDAECFFNPLRALSVIVTDI